MTHQRDHSHHRVLVTGVSGFIGSWIARFLVGEQHTVIGTWQTHPDRVPDLNWNDGATQHASRRGTPAGSASSQGRSSAADGRQHGQSAHPQAVSGDRASLIAASSAEGETIGSAFASVQLDLADLDQVERIVDRTQATAIVHAAAIPDLRTCEQEPERAHRINVEATETLAKAAESVGARLLFLSTDQVFDGQRAWLREDDPVSPVHAYGRGKAEAEQRVLAINDALFSVLRISLVYGRSPSGQRSASEQVANALNACLAAREHGSASPSSRGSNASVPSRPRLFVDEYRTPILVDDIAIAVGELIGGTPPASVSPRRDAHRGGGQGHAVDERATSTSRTRVPILHLAGPDRVSRYEFGLAVADLMGVEHDLIEQASLRDIDWSPPRPPDLSLNTDLARSVLSRPPRGVASGLPVGLPGRSRV